MLLTIPISWFNSINYIINSSCSMFPQISS
nr:MAG TPA: hypothetical protein [Caudoviricetes sp.]